MVRHKNSNQRARWLLAGLGLAGIGLWWGVRPAPSMTRAATPAPYSNIYRADYVGPKACVECHEDQHQGWSNGLHRRMNSLGEAIVGDFSDVAVSYAGGRARFFKNADRPFMELTDAEGKTRLFAVTRTIGSRYLQEYVGRQVLADPARATGGEARTYGPEIRLPFGYWLRPQAWFHRQYYDSWYREEYKPDGTLALDPYRPDEKPWAERCAWCHNTYAFDARLVRSDARLIGQGREQYFEQRRSPRSARDRRAIAERNRLPVEELVTVGISCESCHLGGREHAVNGGDISFVPVSPDIAARADAPDLSGGRDSGVVINTLCAQCHSTPAPTYASGGVMRNSAEAMDMATGACMSQITCLNCHDPHALGPGAGAPIQPAHEAACASCHPQIAAAGRDHSRHDSVSCLDCHMPRIVKGVTEAVRTHRISRPVEPSMVAAGEPNACNLCHLDRSIQWTVRALSDRFGVELPLDDETLARYGSQEGEEPAERAVGEVWLASPERNTRAIATSAYSRSPLGHAALHKLVALLDDEVAFYRMWYLFALEDLLGRRIGPDEFRPTAPPGQRWRDPARASLLSR